jgi:hypothetical protein
MPQEVQVGTILVRGWLQHSSPDRTTIHDTSVVRATLDHATLDTEPYLGHWSLVKALDALAVDRKIRKAGWNFFFIASGVRVMFLGTPKTKKINRALHRILGKVSQQHFNSLEVTSIVAKRFLGLPYGVISAHSRHIQQNCYLDGADTRRLSERSLAQSSQQSSQHDAGWAKD